MVQKAKLDILENLPDIPVANVQPQAEGKDKPLSVLKKKWAFNKILLIGAPALIVLLAIAGGVLFYIARTSPSVVVSAKPIPEPVAVKEKKTEVAEKTVKEENKAAKEKIVYLSNFIIDLKDKAGKSKILLCDIIFDVNTQKNTVDLTDRKDIRKLICQVAAAKNAVVLRSIEERKKLKKEILDSVNKILGDEIVQNVYFANYVIM